MGRIGDLVGLDANEAGFDQDGVAVQIVGLPGVAVAAETLAQDRGEVVGEAPAAAGLHFHQQRLAFMHAHAARLADRLGEPVMRAALFIDGVAAFMQHAHQRAGEIGFVVAGGDADILGGAAAERMGADIEPAARGVEADGLHQPLAQGALRVVRERPVQRQTGPWPA